MCTTVIGELSLLHRPITFSLLFIVAKNTTAKYTQILLQLTHMATKYTNACSIVAHGKNCNTKVVFIDYYYFFFSWSHESFATLARVHAAHLNLFKEVLMISFLVSW